MMLGVRRVMKIAVWIMIVIHTRTITIAIVKAMTTIMVVTAIAMGVIVNYILFNIDTTMLRIDTILKQQNITTQELASRMDVSPQYVSEVVNERKNITISSLSRFAKALLYLLLHFLMATRMTS
jgi:DNA-binding Xre family transcriptional regulator